MKLSEQDVIHGIWMLENQLNTASDLARFWMVVGPNPFRYPFPERKNPWYRGLEDEMRKML
jgi:hypothetical protein